METYQKEKLGGAERQMKLLHIYLSLGNTLSLIRNIQQVSWPGYIHHVWALVLPFFKNLIPPLAVPEDDPRTILLYTSTSDHNLLFNTTWLYNPEVIDVNDYTHQSPTTRLKHFQEHLAEMIERDLEFFHPALDELFDVCSWFLRHNCYCVVSQNTRKEVQLHHKHIIKHFPPSSLHTDIRDIFVLCQD